MRLISARVQKYKSINDSNIVDIEPGVTTLVGKNESGKSAFLEALYRINPVTSGLREEFQELYDYPRRRRNADREKIPSTQPIEATFELDAQDIEALEEHFGRGILKSKTIKVSKNYENTRLWTFPVDEYAAVKHFMGEAGMNGSANESLETLDALRQFLEDQAERSDEANKLLQKLNNYDLQAAIRRVLIPRLPKFLYFDEYSTLPGRFSIPRVQQAAEEDLNKEERTALAFLRLAVVDTAEFLETNYEARKASLEAAAIQISDEVFEFWSQNKELEVEVDVDFKTGQSNPPQVTPFLEIRIENRRHRVSLNFSERSTGFVWFFSFLAFFSEFRNSAEQYIILLDEPGHGLHGAAQEDLLTFIDERLGPSHQVIYTTHSLFMIDATQLERVRTVEDTDEAGTKISDEVLSVSRDTIAPLQGALGVRLSQTLFVGPDNLIVEGPSDMLYLQIISTHLTSMGRTGLDPRWILVPAGGAGNIPAFVSLFHTQLNLAVLLDVKSGGNQKIDNLVGQGILEQNHVFPLTQITGGTEADIEDMFEVSFYLQLLKGAGVASLRVKDLPPDNCVLKRIEKHLGGRFDHYRPAAYFQREQNKLLDKLNDKTLDRFEDLFGKVNGTLS